MYLLLQRQYNSHNSIKQPTYLSWPDAFSMYVCETVFLCSTFHFCIFFAAFYRMVKTTLSFLCQYRWIWKRIRASLSQLHLLPVRRKRKSVILNSTMTTQQELGILYDRHPTGPRGSFCSCWGQGKWKEETSAALVHI